MGSRRLLDKSYNLTETSHKQDIGIGDIGIADGLIEPITRRHETRRGDESHNAFVQALLNSTYRGLVSSTRDRVAGQQLVPRPRPRRRAGHGAGSPSNAAAAPTGNRRLNGAVAQPKKGCCLFGNVVLLSVC